MRRSAQSLRLSPYCRKWSGTNDAAGTFTAASCQKWAEQLFQGLKEPREPAAVALARELRTAYLAELALGLERREAELCKFKGELARVEVRAPAPRHLLRGG